MRKLVRRLLVAGAVAMAALLIAWLIYFPGRQTPTAFTLATGLDVHGLQARVDPLEATAVADDDGLGEHLAQFNLARPSVVHSAWDEPLPRP